MAIRPTSVIVCTHNRAGLLPGTLGRLRAQDYPAGALEIIVVDNCSNDLTPKVVEGFVTTPGVPVRYVAENQLGITAARNRGAVEARHPYLAYLDDDCSVAPDWLSQLVSGFDQRDDVVVVGGRVVLDWSHTRRPAWLGSALEQWLGANSYLGSRTRLLGEETQVMESNMAVKRDAWQSAGGFLGMEQFGSRNMAAGEVLYLLQRLRRQNGQVVFVPEAVAVHRMGPCTRRGFLRRAYWQGVSDGLLDWLIHRRSWLLTIGHAVGDTAAMVVLFGLAFFSYMALSQEKGMSHLVRANRRLGLALSELRLVGAWPRVWSWASTHRITN